MDSLTNSPIIQAKINFDIFPDPASEYVFIRTDNVKPVMIELYDLNGSLITQQIMTDKTYQLNLAEVKCGMYLLKLTYNNTFVTKKIVKE